MKKQLRSILAAVLVIALALAAIPALAEGEKSYAPEAVNGNTFSNEYISFTVDTDARLSAYTTAAGTRMLFGHSSGSGNYGNTSYTTISVNGSQTKFGSNLSVAPSFQGNTNYSAQTVNGVLVEQKLTPVNNDQGEESIVEWRYIYTNNSSANRSVGCRIMLDTCLGDEDGAPFRLPNNNSISYETQISSNVPRYWFTYTDAMTVQGSFGHDNTLPNTLQFGEWRYETGFIFTTEHGLWVTEWNYTVDTSEYIDDSAVAATWNETTLAPGETIEYVMYYGLGDVQQQQYGQLELTLNGDHSVEVNAAGDGYVPNPVTLMGILENVGNGTAANAYERIELPAGLTLIGDATYNAGNIASHGEVTHTWNYTIDETSYEDRWFTIRVYYGCDGQDEAYAEWTLFVPGVPMPVVYNPPVVDAVRAELRNRQPNDTRVDVRFIFNVTFNDSFVTYKGANYGPGDVYQVTGYRTVLTTQGTTITVPGTTIFEMHEGSFVFTAVVKNMRPVNYDKNITAVAYLDYVEVATGIAGADNTADAPITVCVNDLLG